MHWRAIWIVVAGIWAMAAFAQSPAPAVNVAPPWTGASPDSTRALRELVKKYSQESRESKTAACAIPLLEVPVAGSAIRIPTIRPRGEPENIDRMPSVALPAPPCQEEKR